MQKKITCKCAKNYSNISLKRDTQHIMYETINLMKN